MSALRQLKSAVQKFHSDERGLEAIQVVMILAVAAVALIVVKNKWDAIKKFFNDNTDQATQFTA
jgi:Flp pilus assembly pilin Flp